MKDLKLNFTKDEVYADFEDAPVSYEQELQQDLLTLHAAHEKDVELIEKLRSALHNAQIMFVNIEVESDKKYAQEIQAAISAVEIWREGEG
mgnify:CR=1 FL=1